MKKLITGFKKEKIPFGSLLCAKYYGNYINNFNSSSNLPYKFIKSSIKLTLIMILFLQMRKLRSEEVSCFPKTNKAST